MAYIGITSATDSEQLSPNYIGFQPTTQRPSSAFVVDTFTGDGIQTVFPLSNPKPITSRALLVSVAGYTMVPVIDYNLDQYFNLEFTVPPAGSAAIVVHHLIFPKNEATTTIRKLDDISSQFNGITTRFTLTANGAAANILGENVLIISIDGVIQEPGVAYTLDSTDVVFSEAPHPDSSFYAIDIGTTGIGTPSDATVSAVKLLTDNEPTTGKVLAVSSSGNLTWATVSGSVGATELDGLADVSITAPLAGQILRYNGSNFINARLDYSDLSGPPNLAAVALTGDYSDLTNTPSIPTDLNAFTDSTGLLFDGDYASLTNLPNIPNELTDLADIEILNIAANDTLIWNGNKWINDSLTLNDLGIIDGTAGQVLTTDGAGNFTFTTVSGGGFSGNYNDLTNIPTIPTAVSELTNDSGYLTTVAWVDITGAPTAVSEFTNDSGYLTSYTETSTLDDVVLRDATTTSSITVGGLTSTGILKIDDAVHEGFQTKASVTGTTTYDCSTGHIFYHSSVTTNFIVNLTNLNLASGYATTVTLVIAQGATGYYPTAVQIAGVNQTLNWQGNTTPTPSTNRTDVVSLSILNNSGTYIVLGQLTGF